MFYGLMNIHRSAPDASPTPPHVAHTQLFFQASKAQFKHFFKT